MFQPVMVHYRVLITLNDLMDQRQALVVPDFVPDPDCTNVAQRSFGNSERVYSRLMVAGLLPSTWSTERLQHGSLLPFIPASKVTHGV